MTFLKFTEKQGVAREGLLQATVHQCRTEREMAKASSSWGAGDGERRCAVGAGGPRAGVHVAAALSRPIRGTCQLSSVFQAKAHPGVSRAPVFPQGPGNVPTWCPEP